MNQAGKDGLLSFYKDFNVHLQIERIYYLKRMKVAAEVHKDHEAILKGYANKGSRGFKEIDHYSY